MGFVFSFSSQRPLFSDQIERSVLQSVEHTSQANVELDSAIRAQKCGRKKKCILIVLILVLLAIILVPILITQLS